MIKKLLLLILLCLPFIGLSQTKDETQNWIKEKIEQYAYTSIDVKHEHTIKYQDDAIWIGKKVLFSFGPGVPSIYTIPIKDISTIRFIEKESTIFLKIQTKGNKLSIVDYNIVTEKEDFQSSLELVMSKDIKNNNLQNRLIKSFNHLIKLSGGTITKEVF
jgi:hypothetical protein